VHVVLLHPNGHRQVRHAPDRNTDLPRSSRSVGQACAECRETGPLRSEGGRRTARYASYPAAA
jgi:hypothetical protein